MKACSCISSRCWWCHLGGLSKFSEYSEAGFGALMVEDNEEVVRQYRQDAPCFYRLLDGGDAKSQEKLVDGAFAYVAKLPLKIRKTETCVPLVLPNRFGGLCLGSIGLRERLLNIYILLIGLRIGDVLQNLADDVPPGAWVVAPFSFDKGRHSILIDVEKTSEKPSVPVDGLVMVSHV